MIPLTFPFSKKDEIKALAPGYVQWDPDGSRSGLGFKTWFYYGDELPAALEPYRASKSPTRLWVLNIPFQMRETAALLNVRWNPKYGVSTFQGNQLPWQLAGLEAQPFSREMAIQKEINKVAPTFHPGDGYFIPRPHQETGIEEIWKAYQAGLPGFLLADQVGLGKEQSVDDSVMTPTGYKKIGKLKVGDRIIGASTGKTQKILGVFPQGKKLLYRITFNDGTFCTAGADHLWNVATPDDFARRPENPWRTVTTKEILEQQTRSTDKTCHWSIPLTAPIHFKKTPKPRLDPYLLGTLIANEAMITGSKIKTRHTHQRERLEKTLPKDLSLKPAFPSTPNTYRISPKRPGGKNPIVGHLKKLGLYGKADHQKKLPKSYLFAGHPKERHALLQGLLGTDNSTDHPRIKFASSSRQLANDLVFLVRSLGGWAALLPPKPSKSPRPQFQVDIQLPTKMTGFGRNDDPGQKPPAPHKKIDKIELIGKKPAVCIAVNDPKHLYLTNDLIVTHNTVTAWEGNKKVANELLKQATAKTGGLDILIVCPKNAIAHWRDSLGHLGVGHHNVTVINYDQLKKLFDIPKLKPATVKKGRKKTEVQRTVKTLKGVAKFGQPHQYNIIIWDESHYLCNLTAARTKLAFKLYEACDFMLWISATAGQNPLEMGYLAPLLSSRTGNKAVDVDQYEKWCQALGISVRRSYFGKWEWGCMDSGRNYTEGALKGKPIRIPDPEQRKADCQIIHQLLFERKNGALAALRRTPSDIQGWPEINRIILPYELSEDERATYNLAWSTFCQTTQGYQADNPKLALVEIMRFRQKASLIRAGGTVAQCLDLLANGHQVAISFEFIDSLNEVEKKLTAEGIVTARITGQHPELRESERLRYQRGEAPVVLFTVKEAVSFHQGQKECGGNDLPRSQIDHDIRWSAKVMSQIDGRSHRDGKFAQVYWMVAQETIEVKVAESLLHKIESMSNLLGDDESELLDVARDILLTAKH
jgi:hypothetical protein